MVVNVPEVLGEYVHFITCKLSLTKNDRYW